MSANRPRILVIDDEPQIHRSLGPALDAAGYEPLRADTGAAGLAAIANSRCDAVIMDLSLSDMDGMEALRRARGFYDGPILVLSACEMEQEIDALDCGADDYVEKPIRVGEVLARLQVAVRRRLIRLGSPVVVHAGEVQIDLLKRLVRRGGLPVKLSPHEYGLLAHLAEAGGKVLTHKQLLTAIWGPNHANDVQYLRVFMGHLRQKLESDPSSPRYLVTDSGVGYRFLAD